MKTISKIKSKAFSTVKNRPNKVAKGMTYTHERHAAACKKSGNNYRLSGDASRCSLFGTAAKGQTTILRRTRKVLKPHPVDKGYYKEVLILSDYGRLLLNTYRRNNI